MAPRRAMQVGERTVVAMSCRQCGKLKSGDQFPRYRRSFKDRMSYVSRRCRTCWWDRLASNTIGRHGERATA